METTSISGSEKTRSGSVVCQAPSCSPATAATDAGSMSQKPRTAMSASAAAPRACSLPAEPHPISAQPSCLESFTMFTPHPIETKASRQNMNCPRPVGSIRLRETGGVRHPERVHAGESEVHDAHIVNRPPALGNKRVGYSSAYTDVTGNGKAQEDGPAAR